MTEDNLKKLILDKGLLTKQQLEECMREQSQDLKLGRTHRLLAHIIVEKGYATSQAIQKLVGPPKSTFAADYNIPPDASAAMKNPANIFGKYVRVNVLGRGGMGIVFKAWDSDLKRFVALKFLEGANPDEIKRFQREAQLAASLKHKNIAQIYEMGTVNERHYIAMELLRGQTLDHLIGNIDERKLLAIVAQICDALAYAHSKQIIHRDIKPQNIMVDDTPDGPQAYVMDFGLAKQMAADSSLSMSGVVMGTPQYMSPEQATGDPKAVDHRSDIYSTGALMYHMLAGKPPVVGETPMQIVMNLSSVEAAPLRKVNPLSSKEVEIIVQKCLEKQRDRRYMTAKDLAADIDRFLKGEEIEAKSPSIVYILGRGIRKHKIQLFVIATLVLAFLIGGSMILRSRALADQLIEKAKKDKEAAERHFREGSRLMQAPLKSIGEEARRARKKMLDDAVRELSSAIKLDPKNPLVYLTRAQAYIMQSRQSLAVADFTEALKLDPKQGDALWGRVICQFLQMGEGFEVTLDLKPGSPQLAVTPFSRSFNPEKVAGDLQQLRGLGNLYTSKVKCIEGMLLFFEGKLSEAQNRFSEALKEELFAEAYALRGYAALVKLHEEFGAKGPDTNRQMMMDLSKAIELEPNIPIYYVIRCIAGGDVKMSMEDIDEAIEINPDDADLYIVKAYVYILMNDSKQAWSMVEIAREKEAKNPRIDMMVSYLQWSAGEKSEAVKTLDAALKANPDYGALYYLRGLYELALKDLEHADRDFAQYLSMLPPAQRQRAEFFIKRLKDMNIAKRMEDFGTSQTLKELLDEGNKARESGDLETSLNKYRAIVMRTGPKSRKEAIDKETQNIVVEANIGIIKIHLQRKEIPQALRSIEMIARSNFTEWDRFKKDPTLKKFFEDPRVQEIIKNPSAPRPPRRDK